MQEISSGILNGLPDQARNEYRRHFPLTTQRISWSDRKCVMQDISGIHDQTANEYRRHFLLITQWNSWSDRKRVLLNGIPDQTRNEYYSMEFLIRPETSITQWDSWSDRKRVLLNGFLINRKWACKRFPADFFYAMKFPIRQEIHHARHFLLIA